MMENRLFWCLKLTFQAIKSKLVLMKNEGEGVEKAFPRKQIARGILVGGMMLSAAGCKPAQSEKAVNAVLAVEPTISLVTDLPTPTTMPEPTKTIEPTLVPEPVAFEKERELTRGVMEKYGFVDEEKLSDEYWNRIKEGIDKYGPAKRVIAFEFHGDDYSMYGGAYSMMPEKFEGQMRYLLENEYHFVTGPELVGYVDGWLTLPARSVIMTTDSGAASMKSLPRMTALFETLKSEYGYAPHFNSYIWTKDMTSEESIGCADNRCWEAFDKALHSGFFSIGTHTESHDYFAEFTVEQGLVDLEQSRQEIKDNLGVTVNGITWPFESCPITWMNQLKDHGFTYAYGGWSRSLGQGYTYPNDKLAFCLPRIFPPNPNGMSGRPAGQTLEQMLKTMEEYVPLK